MPFIDDRNDKLLKWKYIVDELYILYPDGTSTKVPGHRVNSISIIHLYESNLFPIFRVELTLASYTYYKIINSKNNVKFKLRIQKYSTKIDGSEKGLNRDWINDTFDLILDDDDYNANENLEKEKKELEYDTVVDTDIEDDLFQVDNVMEFFLFKSSLVDKFNTVINAILSNATVNDAFQYIATKIGLNNVLMSNFHNIKTYDELVIPPLSAKKAIKFLDTYYGFYKTGMMFYIDMIGNISYLLDYSSKCTAYQKKEYIETDILIPLKSNKHSSELCSLYRRDASGMYIEKYFIIGDNGNISIRNETVSYNAYASTEAKIIDTYDGTVTKSSTTATVKNNKSEKIIENNTENKWFTDIYNSLINSKNIVVEVALTDYDIASLAPNKTFKILFEDTALALKYRKNLLLTEATHTLMRDGESFRLTSIVKLKQF